MAYAENYGITPNSSNLAFRPGSLYNAANVGISKPLGQILGNIQTDMMTKVFDSSNYQLDAALPSSSNSVSRLTAAYGGSSPVNSVSRPTAAYGGSSPVNSASQLDYYLADISKRYGMDKATAYQEALSNSSYQRAVADLRAAGLNPVLALGKVTPADSFSGSFESSGGSSGRSSQSTKDWTKIISNVAKVATSAAAIMRVVSMF